MPTITQSTHADTGFYSDGGFPPVKFAYKGKDVTDPLVAVALFVALGLYLALKRH